MVLRIYLLFKQFLKIDFRYINHKQFNMIANLTLDHEPNFDKIQLVSNWADDEIIDLVDLMEGFSHHAFQSELEAIKINKPR